MLHEDERGLGVFRVLRGLRRKQNGDTPCVYTRRLTNFARPRVYE